jgi:hypothetical protein
MPDQYRASIPANKIELWRSRLRDLCSFQIKQDYIAELTHIKLQNRSEFIEVDWRTMSAKDARPTLKFSPNPARINQFEVTYWILDHINT